MQGRSYFKLWRLSFLIDREILKPFITNGLYRNDIGGILSSNIQAQSMAWCSREVPNITQSSPASEIFSSNMFKQKIQYPAEELLWLYRPKNKQPPRKVQLRFKKKFDKPFLNIYEVINVTKKEKKNNKSEDGIFSEWYKITTKEKKGFREGKKNTSSLWTFLINSGSCSINEYLEMKEHLTDFTIVHYIGLLQVWTSMFCIVWTCG